MEITTAEGSRWIHGNLLAIQDNLINVGPVDPVEVALPEQPLITSQCPQAVWTEGFRFYELIALAERQYRPSVVTGNGVYLRAGIQLWPRYRRRGEWLTYRAPGGEMRRFTAAP